MSGQKQAAYVYIARCADGSLYTGWTTCPDRRIAAHNAGKGAKYTQNRRPVTLVYLEKMDNKIAAQRREYEIKNKTRAEKLSMTANYREDNK